jgi:hypothetical protein
MGLPRRQWGQFWKGGGLPETTTKETQRRRTRRFGRTHVGRTGRYDQAANAGREVAPLKRSVESFLGFPDDT